MSREIKFRCWCNLSEKMLDEVEIEERRLRDLDGDNDQYYMQYTGLKDKNGKEIYEGDIVKGSPEGKNKGQSEVFYGYGQWQPFAYLGSWNEEDYEVIGNVYENPELIN